MGKKEELGKVKSAEMLKLPARYVLQYARSLESVYIDKFLMGISSSLYRNQSDLASMNSALKDQYSDFFRLLDSMKGISWKLNLSLSETEIRNEKKANLLQLREAFNAFVLEFYEGQASIWMPVNLQNESFAHMLVTSFFRLNPFGLNLEKIEQDLKTIDFTNPDEQSAFRAIAGGNIEENLLDSEMRKFFPKKYFQMLYKFSEKEVISPFTFSDWQKFFEQIYSFGEQGLKKDKNNLEKNFELLAIYQRGFEVLFSNYSEKTNKVVSDQLRVLAKVFSEQIVIFLEREKRINDLKLGRQVDKSSTNEVNIRFLEKGLKKEDTLLSLNLPLAGGGTLSQNTESAYNSVVSLVLDNTTLAVSISQKKLFGQELVLGYTFLSLGYYYKKDGKKLPVFIVAEPELAAYRSDINIFLIADSICKKVYSSTGIPCIIGSSYNQVFLEHKKELVNSGKSNPNLTRISLSPTQEVIEDNLDLKPNVPTALQDVGQLMKHWFFMTPQSYRGNIGIPSEQDILTINAQREREYLTHVVKVERESWKNTLGYEFEVPPLPKEITPEIVNNLRFYGFELFYIPKMDLPYEELLSRGGAVSFLRKVQDKYKLWHPSEGIDGLDIAKNIRSNFWYLVREGKLVRPDLSGRWIAIETFDQRSRNEHYKKNNLDDFWDINDRRKLTFEEIKIVLRPHRQNTFLKSIGLNYKSINMRLPEPVEWNLLANRKIWNINYPEFVDCGKKNYDDYIVMGLLGKQHDFYTMNYFRGYINETSFRLLIDFGNLNN